MQAAKSSAASFNCWAFHLCCQYHRTIWYKSKRSMCKPNYCQISYLHRKLYAWKKAATLASHPLYRPRILPHWAPIKSKMFSSMAPNYFEPNTVFNANFPLDFRKMSDLSVDQLKTLTSIYELVCFLIHLNEHFLAQFCDSVYIIANDLLRHFLSDGNTVFSSIWTFSKQDFWILSSLQLYMIRKECKSCAPLYRYWALCCVKHQKTLRLLNPSYSMTVSTWKHFCWTEISFWSRFLLHFFRFFFQIRSFQWIGSLFLGFVCVIFCEFWADFAVSLCKKHGPGILNTH